MNIKSLAKNAAFAFLAQGVALGVSITTTLLVPKVLGVEQFGYWQLFIFYSSYIGFCHFGLNDGVYLVNGGKNRDSIPKASVASQFFIGLLFQTGLAILVLWSILASDLGTERDIVLISTAIYMLVKNSASYLGYVFQAVNETILFSVSCILERVAFLLPLLCLLLLRIDDFEVYILIYLIAGVIQLAYCLWFGRFLFFDGLETPAKALGESISSIRIGIRLMLANIASQLILGIVRFIIDFRWGIETFGQLSLSLSMVNFFLAFMTQASMVLFPALRQSGHNEQKSFYRAVRDGMALAFPAFYLAYYPMKWFIETWLPQYSISVLFFSYLLPVCVFDSKMNISCTTMFKVRRRENALFYINVIMTLLSAFGSIAGAYIFNSMDAIVIWAALVIVLRSYVSEIILNRELSLDFDVKIAVGELAVTLMFTLLSKTLPTLPGVLLFLAIYATFLWLNRKTFVSVVTKIKYKLAQ